MASTPLTILGELGKELLRMFHAMSSRDLNASAVTALCTSRDAIAASPLCEPELVAALSSRSRPIPEWLIRHGKEVAGLREDIRSGTAPPSAASLLASVDEGLCPSVADAERLIAESLRCPDSRHAAAIAMPLLELCRGEESRVERIAALRSAFSVALGGGGSSRVDQVIPWLDTFIACAHGLIFEVVGSEAVHAVVAKRVLGEADVIAGEVGSDFSSKKHSWRLSDVMANVWQLIEAFPEVPAVVSSHVPALLLAFDEIVAANPTLSLLRTAVTDSWKADGVRSSTERLAGLCKEARNDAQTMDMAREMARMVHECVTGKIVVVEAPPIKGTTNTPIGRTQFTIAGVSLSGLSSSPSDISVSLDGPVVTFRCSDFSATVNGFTWSYELDTGVSMVRDSGAGSAGVMGGTISLSLEVALPSPGVAARLSIRGLEFSCGRVTVRVDRSEKMSEGVYNLLLGFAAEKIGQALQTKVQGVVTEQCTKAIKMANDFLEEHAPVSSQETANGPDSSRQETPPTSMQQRATDLRDFFDSDDFL